jgi:RHS repeat-associated protein
MLASNDLVMGNWTFTPDTLNRLASATNLPVSSTSTSYYCWSYDGFGNRTLQGISSAAFATGPPACTPQTSASYEGVWADVSTGNNNQFSKTQQAVGGVVYDGAGNILNDGVNQYLYDGEGRICAVAAEGVSGALQLSGYIYNAQGQRIAKGSITAWSCDPTVNGFKPMSDYVLGLSGEQVTEMGMDASGVMAWQHTNVYALGQLIATYDNDGLHFYLNDPLGTRRAQTDYAGVLEQTCASLPFGDALNCTNSLQFPTEHHFTGKERDAESGNDYFGARYYGSNMGRFMSPDWSAKATPVPYAKLDNPQSLNLYAYVGNNPLSHMDPDGHIDCSGKNAQGAGCQAIAQWNSDHGIHPNAKTSNFPGVPVKLPNGNTVPDPHSPTGVMMAPTSSLSDVAAAGKKAGQDAQRLDSQSVGGVVFNVELGRAVGTGGQFDDQRMGSQSDVITGGFMQLPQFRDVSNFNVGLFSQQAGMTLDQTLQTAGDFAKQFSSNYSPNSPYGLAPQTAEFIRNGWQAGATQY